MGYRQNIEIDALINHSKTMLKNAESGSWEAVTKDGQVFRAMLDSYFSEQASREETADVEGVKELLTLNITLQKLASEARDTAMLEMKSIDAGKQAVDAYTKNSR